MRRIRAFALLLVIWFLSCAGIEGINAGERPRRIAVFGSSVAYGTGDQMVEETDRLWIEPVGDVGTDGRQKVRFKLLDLQGEGEMMIQTKGKPFANMMRSDGISFSIRRGYQGRLRELLTNRGWDVLNCSCGGDRTDKLMKRYDPELLPQKPGYVFLGLSLANEGLKRPSKDTLEKKQAVCDTFTKGMKTLIERIRKDGMGVAVSLNYPHGVYTPTDYELLKQVNLEMNAWDVPSANFLGALDDGHGHWVPGYHVDNGHPNPAGHLELFYTIVPTLFESLEAGKPTPVRRIEQNNSWKLSPEKGEYLCFDSEFTIHSHAVFFRVRLPGNGVLASASGQGKGWQIEVKEGKAYYRGLDGNVIGEGAMVTDNAWHTIAITHRWAARQTEFYVDGRFVGRVPEQFAPQRFILGADANGQRGAPAEYGEWMVYRSSPNAEEVTRLHEGGLIQASMELYCPLNGDAIKENQPVENRAQSLSQVKYIR